MLGATCNPCCGQGQPVYAITLSEMDSISWHRSYWSADKYNVTLLPLGSNLALGNGLYVCRTGTGSVLMSYGIQAIAGSWPQEATVIIFNATTNIEPIAWPSLADLVLKITPSDPFDYGNPSWQVYQQKSDGSRVLLDGVRAALWRVQDFDPESFAPGLPAVTQGENKATRLCGFDTSQSFGPFDISLSVSASPRPLNELAYPPTSRAEARIQYDQFVQEAQQYAELSSGTYTTNPAAACARVSNYQGTEGSWSVQVFSGAPFGRIMPVGYMTDSGYFASVNLPLPQGGPDVSWRECSLSGSFATFRLNFYQYPQGEYSVPVNCRGPFFVATPAVSYDPPSIDICKNVSGFFQFSATLTFSGSVQQS